MKDKQLTKKIVVLLCILLLTTPILPLVIAGEPQSLRSSSLPSSSPPILTLATKDLCEEKDCQIEGTVLSQIPPYPLALTSMTYDYIFDVNPAYPPLPWFGIFNTIQSALDYVNSVSGSVRIRVSSDTYYENIIIPSNREILLEGGITTIRGSDIGDAVVTVDSPHELFQMKNFTIESNMSNRGIFLSNYIGFSSFTHAVLLNIHIQQCHVAGLGAGMYIVNSQDFLLVNISVSNCSAAISSTAPEGNGAGIAFDTCSNMKLELLTINDCIATTNGGGLYFFNCWPSIIRLWGFHITGCQALVYGGGICFHDSEYIQLGGTQQPYPPEDSDITLCYALYGGGIAIINSFYWSQISGVTLHDVHLTDNVGIQNGGGLYSNIPTIVTCRFSEITGNIAQNGGGIYLENGGNLYTTYGTKVYGNTATYKGGGIYGDFICYIIVSDLGTTAYIYGNHANQGGGVYLTESLVHLNGFGYGGAGQQVHIYDNHADNQGGGFYIRDSYPDSWIVNTKIYDNSATHGAGVYFSEENNLDLIRCIVSHNIAQQNGGGICCIRSHPTFQQLTIADNQAASGSALYTSLIEEVHFTSSIVWNNMNEQLHGLITVTYSDIQGGYPGQGNFNQNPCFVNPAGNDYSLYQASPCIDSGDPSLAFEPDGTQADRGAFTASLDAYEFEGGTTNWKSFPLLHPGIDAYQFFMPLIQEGSLLEVRDDEGRRLYYHAQQGQWINEIGAIQSQKGYKVRLTTLPPGQQYTSFESFGYRLDPQTVLALFCASESPTPNMYDNKENWVGYFLPSSSSVKTAFASVMNVLSYIQTTNWLMYRTSPTGQWQLIGTWPFTVQYGDMVVVKCYKNCKFIWNAPSTTNEQIEKTPS